MHQTPTIMSRRPPCIACRDAPSEKFLGTGWRMSNGATIALAVVLAFLFGYALTASTVLRTVGSS